MKFLAFVLSLLIASVARAIIPVTDAAAIAQQQLSTAEELAKWAESIAQLKTQIGQLDQQITIQGDLRSWIGNPVAAAAGLSLGNFNASVLVQSYGSPQSAIVNVGDSLASLGNSSSGTYRTLDDADMNGGTVPHDSLTYRRYAVMDAQQANYQQVATSTQARQQQLQQDLAATLADLKTATTVSQIEADSAKINAINGQLSVLSASRHDAADEVNAQKTANESRLVEDRYAAAELEAQDDYLSSQRISAYMQTIKLRQNSP